MSTTDGNFAHTGQCIEQPAENKPFCEKVWIESYPTDEHLGLIFGYFEEHPDGRKIVVPPLPRWPELENFTLTTSIQTLPCNYFQSAENIVDDVHVYFAHRTSHLSQSSRMGVPSLITAKETSYGLCVELHHSNSIEKNHYLMANSCYLRHQKYGKNDRGETVPNAEIQVLFWYVPIDDVSHHHIFVSTVKELAPGGTKSIPPPADPGAKVNVSEQILAILAGKVRLQDLEERHPELVRIQDGTSIVGQGAIADRQGERLGQTDKAVILLRKLWQRELRALAEGQPLAPFVRPKNLQEL